MKIKFLSIFAAASLLVACGGNAEEAQTELEGALENLEAQLDNAIEEAEETNSDVVEAVDSTVEATMDEVHDAAHGEEAAH